MSREMRHSGVQWIGDIPKEWKIPRLKNVAELHGRIGWNGLRSDEFEEDSYAYLVTGQDFISSEISWNKCYQIRRERYEEDPFIQLNNGEILVTKDGTIGKIAIVSKMDKPGCLNSGIFVLRQKTETFVPKFLYWQLYSSLLKTYNDYMNLGGTTIIHLYQNVFERMPLLTPSLSEQQKIADYLDKLCGEVDELIALQEQMIEELKAYKQSVITEAVTKGLNPDVPMIDSGIRWVKEIPSHWAIVTPKALFSLRKDKAIPGERQLTASQQYGIIYQDEYMKLTGSKVVTVMKDFDILKHVENGDFVISMRSFQGGLEYSQYPGSISSAYVMLIPNHKYVYPRFYRWLFKSECYINALQSTSNMVRDGQAMRFSNFVQIPLFIIPLAEQQAIATYLDEKCSEIDSLITIKQAKIDELKEYKKSIIYEYVTGKKEVPYGE